MLDGFDAATDSPIAAEFEALDAFYPGSKFIYTVRDVASWLESCSRQFGSKGTKNIWKKQIRHKLYGADIYDELLFRRAYAAHEAKVMAYFANRPDDLLVLNICGGEGWEKLCPFLGLPKPSFSFPLRNKTKTPRDPAGVLSENLKG